jgi:flagellin
MTVLTTSGADLVVARSRILDTDYTTETIQLSKAQILQKASTAMLAQANNDSKVVLSLLK